jgi:hypothetical protein
MTIRSTYGQIFPMLALGTGGGLVDALWAIINQRGATTWSFGVLATIQPVSIT